MVSIREWYVFESLRILLPCALPVHAGMKVIDNLGVEAQQRPMWCWAAVSVMGIRSFDQTPKFKHLSQVEVVARRLAGAINLQAAKDLPTAKAIHDNETTCAAPGNCNTG